MRFPSPLCMVYFTKIRLLKRIQINICQQILQFCQFIGCQSNTFSHSAVIRRPVTIIVFRFLFIPANQIQFLAPSSCVFAQRAKILYDFLDQSKLFKGTVVPEDRSLMNVPFVTGDKDMDAKFVKEAKEAGLVNLKGHRTVGGMRASIYNAMPKEGVEALVAFMKKFEEENA